MPSAIPCNLSPLIHSFLFSGWRRTVSSKFFDTQISLISTEELVLPRHARCVLSRLRCNGHSLLLSSYLFRIGRIENLSCSASGHSYQGGHLSSHSALTSYGLIALARFLVTPCLSSTSDPRPRELPGFWGSKVLRHAPISRNQSGYNNNNKNKIVFQFFTKTHYRDSDCRVHMFYSLFDKYLLFLC